MRMSFFALAITIVATWTNVTSSSEAWASRSAGTPVPSTVGVAPDTSSSGPEAPQEDELDAYLRETEVAGAEALLTEAQEAPSEGCAYFAEEEVLRAAEVMANYREHVRSKAAAAQPRASFQWDAILRWMATVHVRLLLTVTDELNTLQYGAVLARLG